MIVKVLAESTPKFRKALETFVPGAQSLLELESAYATPVDLQ